MNPTTQPQVDPQIQAIMQKYNYTPQGQPATPSNDWNDFKNGTGAYAPPPAPVTPEDQFNKDMMSNPVIKTAVDTAKNYGGTLASQVPNLVEGKGGEVFDQLNRGNLERTNDTSANPAIRAGENALGGTMQVINTIFAPFGAGLKAISDNLGQAAASNPAILNNPVVGKITDFVQGNANAISKMAQDHPEAARNLGNIFGVILTALSGEEGGKLGLFEGKGLDTGVLPGTFENPKPLVDAAKEKAGNIIENVKTGAQATKEAATATGAETIEGVKGITKGAKELIAGKTPEEILSTAPEDVAKLKPAQQEYWKNENINKPVEEQLKAVKEGKQQDISNIQAESGSKQAVIKQQGDAEAARLEKELNDAKTGVSKATIEDVNNMKEQARTVIGQKSDEFATLRNKEMTGFRRVATNNQEISDFIDKEVPNKADAQTIKETLGINEDNLKTKTNLSKVEQLSREIRDKVGRGVATGNQPASTSDFFYSKSAGLLDDFMGSKGVDLSGSKSMWKNWTPTRDTLVKDFNVYDYKNVEPAPASKMIETRLKGLDAKYNAKLADVEKTLGQSLDAESKTAYQKMTDAEQAKVNSEIKTANDMATEKAKAAFDKAEATRMAQEKSGKITAQQSEQLEKINKDNLMHQEKTRTVRIAKNIVKLVAAGIVGAELERGIKNLTGLGF